MYAPSTLAETASAEPRTEPSPLAWFGIMLLGGAAWIGFLWTVDDGSWHAEHVAVVTALDKATCRTDDGRAEMHWDLNPGNHPYRMHMALEAPVIRINGDAPESWTRTLANRTLGSFPEPGKVHETFGPGRRMTVTEFDALGMNRGERGLPHGPPLRYWVTNQAMALGENPEAGAMITGDTLALVHWEPGRARMYHGEVRYAPEGKYPMKEYAGRPGPTMNQGWTMWGCTTRDNQREDQ